jgi:hypothetical protein
VKKAIVGLAIGTTMTGATAVRAETDPSCFGAVVELYMAQRASGSLDYLVCKAACSETAPASRSACRAACRQDRSASAREAREDADALRSVCEGGGGAASRVAAGVPVPSTCAPNLSECAETARASARICDRGSDDVLSDCAADVSAAVDQCAADFVDCAVPVEESEGQ